MTFFVVICSGCTPALPQPFEDASEMGEWVAQHVWATGHTCVVFREERL